LADNRTFSYFRFGFAWDKEIVPTERPDSFRDASLAKPTEPFFGEHVEANRAVLWRARRSQPSRSLASTAKPTEPFFGELGEANLLHFTNPQP
jgi:hypothetical protein